MIYKKTHEKSKFYWNQKCKKIVKKCANYAKHSLTHKIKLVEKFIWNSAMSNKKQLKKSKLMNFKKQ